MAIALVANVGAGSATSNNVTTGSIDTTGADLIVIVVSAYGGAPTLSDSKGNTWTARTSYGPIHVCKIYYCASPTVGSGHTFTLTSSTLYPTVNVAAFSGTHATPYDVENGYAEVGAPSTTGQPGSVTPSEDNEVLITGTTHASTVSSIGSSFTITDNIAYGAGTNIGGAMAYKIQTSAGAENPTWTYGSAQYFTASIATFKAGGGGAAVVSRLCLLGVG